MKEQTIRLQAAAGCALSGLQEDSKRLFSKQRVSTSVITEHFLPKPHERIAGNAGVGGNQERNLLLPKEARCLGNRLTGFSL